MKRKKRSPRKLSLLWWCGTATRSTPSPETWGKNVICINTSILRHSSYYVLPHNTSTHTTRRKSSITTPAPVSNRLDYKHNGRSRCSLPKHSPLPLLLPQILPSKIEEHRYPGQSSTMLSM